MSIFLLLKFMHQINILPFLSLTIKKTYAHFSLWWANASNIDFNVYVKHFPLIEVTQYEQSLYNKRITSNTKLVFLPKKHAQMKKQSTITDPSSRHRNMHKWSHICNQIPMLEDEGMGYFLKKTFWIDRVLGPSSFFFSGIFYPDLSIVGRIFPPLLYWTAWKHCIRYWLANSWVA